MESDRWRQVEELYQSALQIAPGQRPDFLKNACRGDAKLCEEVESLLAYESSAKEFMETPAFEVAAKQMAGEEARENQADPVAVGEALQRFRILEKLGSGGMGIVYKAEDIRLHRTVALKFLPKKLVRDPASLERFEREAHAASSLNHPNICTLYDIGEHEGQTFIAMELLEGQTLDSRIGTQPLKREEWLNFGIQITEGLLAAHHKGIIHRDIKPSNIFITLEGQAKILDFGLAKLTSPAGTPENSLPQYDIAHQNVTQGVAQKPILSPALDLSISLTGVAMGTAGYMSPEQIRGEKLDARTDLFSFGLVLYEMVTGQRAFKGDTGPAFQEAILKQAPTPAREVNPELPAELERIITKGLEKDPEARYQTASEMRSDLEALRQELEPKRPARWREVAIGVVLVGIIAGATLWFTKRQSSSSLAIPDQKLRQLTFNSNENPVTGGSISPDGRYLAYSDAKGMHIKNIGTGETRSVTLPEAVKNDNLAWAMVSNAWFPDSTRFLAYTHPANEDRNAWSPQTPWSSETSTIWMIPLQGGVPQKVRDNAEIWSISPDGASISFGTNPGKLGDREIWLMTQSGDRARKLYEVGENSAICCLQFSPSGESAVYVETDNSGDALLSRDLQGGSPLTIFPSSYMNTVKDFAWLPDGRLIYAVTEKSAAGDNCNYWGMRLDARSGQPLEKPRRLTNWAGFCMEDINMTADGKHLTFRKWSTYASTYVANLKPGGTGFLTERHFTLTTSFDIPDDWTADSKAMILGSDRAGNWGIYKQALTEDEPSPLLTGPDGLRNFHVSPDGKWVIYEQAVNPGDASTPLNTMRVPIDGGAPQFVFTAKPRSSILCARTPSKLCLIEEPTEDSKHVVFTAFDPLEGRGAELAKGC